MRVVLCTACPHCIQFGATSTVFKQLCALASMIIQMPTVRNNVMHSTSTRNRHVSAVFLVPVLRKRCQNSCSAHSGLTVNCYPGRVQNEFSFAAHMDRQRLSTGRSIFRCYVTLCACVTHQVLRSRSYRRCYRGIKMLQVPSFFMDFGDQWLEISVLKFSAFWPRRFGHNLFKKWDLSGRLSQEIWRCTVARRSGVIKNSLSQFILLRLSNLYLNFEGCTVCLMYLWRIWSIHDFMYVLCIFVVKNFRFKSKWLRDCPSNRDPWPLTPDPWHYVAHVLSTSLAWEWDAWISTINPFGPSAGRVFIVTRPSVSQSVSLSVCASLAAQHEGRWMEVQFFSPK